MGNTFIMISAESYAGMTRSESQSTTVTASTGVTLALRPITIKNCITSVSLAQVTPGILKPVLPLPTDTHLPTSSPSSFKVSIMTPNRGLYVKHVFFGGGGGEVVKLASSSLENLHARR